MATDIAHEILADILADYPGWRGVLGEFGIDGRHGMNITLAAAAARAGIDVSTVTEALSGGRRAGIDCVSADRAPLSALIRHIEEVHHAFLRREFPRIARLIDDRRRGESDAQAWLARLDELFCELREDMEPHLLVEEDVLFPMCHDIVDASSWPSFHCGPIQEPIKRLRHDHHHAEELVGELERLLSRDGAPAVAAGDPGLEAIVTAVRLLDEDLRRHLAEEDEMLFPNVLELAAALDDS